MRLIQRAANLRASCLQIPYGDQAIFLRSETFDSVGRFSELPIMEDFELIRRLRHAYKHDRVRTLEIIFSAESFPSLLQRTAFLTRILDQDKKLIASVTERHAEVQRQLEILEQQRIELEYLQREKGDEERQLTALKEERETELARVRTQKAANERAASRSAGSDCSTVTK